MPHELGHQLMNGDILWMEIPGNETHSDDSANWMFRSGSDFSFDQIGFDKGRIEGVQIERLYANGGANNPGFVQVDAGHEDYGNRVDWNFVVDNLALEDRPNNADEHPGGRDGLYFAPGNALATPQASHLQTGLGDFDHPSDFSGSFRYADVFSLTTRYSDFDRTSLGGDFSARNGALDYEVLFIDAQQQQHLGILDTVFASGWTDNTTADDFLGRWRSPVDAVALLILANSSGGIYDGNTQIDAVIVGMLVPEPGVATLILLAFVMVGPSIRSRRATSLTRKQDFQR